MGKYERNMKSLTAGIAFIIILAIGLLTMVLEALGNILKLIFEYWYVVLLVTAIGVAPYGYGKIREANERKKIGLKRNHLSKLLSSLIEVMDDNSELWNEIGSISKEIIGHDSEVKRILEDGYAKLISKVLDDGNISEEERRVLIIAEANINLDQDDIAEIKKAEYIKYYYKAIEDNVLTLDEEQSLLILRLALSLDDKYLENENSILAQMVEVRETKKNGMPIVNCSLGLKIDERCHHEASAREIIRTRNRGNYIYSYGEIGELHITNKRLVFTSSGSIAIPLKDIASAKLMFKQNYIEVIKNGRQTPYYFECDKPILMIHYINSSKEV